METAPYTDAAAFTRSSRPATIHVSRPPMETPKMPIRDASTSGWRSRNVSARAGDDPVIPGVPPRIGPAAIRIRGVALVGIDRPPIRVALRLLPFQRISAPIDGHGHVSAPCPIRDILARRRLPAAVNMQDRGKL